MGTSSADWRGFRDSVSNHAGPQLDVMSEVPGYHFGNKGIDTATWGGPSAPTLVRADLVSLHSAATTSQAAFLTQAATTLGSWWTSLLSTCDNAGCSGYDDPRWVAWTWYKGPITLV